MRELGLLGEIRRRRLVISRGIAEDIGDWRGIRAVVAPQGKDPISDGVSYADTVAPSCVRKLRQRLLQLSVERCLEAWIHVHQDFVSCCSLRFLLGIETRYAMA